MSHKQLTLEKQTALASMLRAGIMQKDIAEILGVTPSAINQEIKRNKDSDGIYRARSAKVKKKSRRIKANERFKKIENDSWLQKHIEKKLKLKLPWTPEQIAGRLKQQGKRRIGKDTIYNWIYEERKDLVKYLKCKKGKYRRRRGTRIREKEREEAKVKRIDERPEIVETRERLGDWEGDTVIGKDKKQRLLTNVDRKSGFGLINKLSLVSAEIVHGKLAEIFKELPQRKKYTYTYDNGAEIGKQDELLERRIKMSVYRAYPYHSWERGSNENFNKLVREAFPKGTDFAKISDEEVYEVEKLLNNRPRKRLNYYTPKEVFFGKNS